MLRFDKNGIFCEQANVYIDPWKPVDRAIITHAHSDHARWGSKHYLCHHDSVRVLKLRLGADIDVTGIGYNELLSINGVTISLHPAGHIPGSAQVRVAYRDEIWVVSGDYKLQRDGISVPFEPVRCHHFVTESTFGLPVYRFPEPEEVYSDINDWWRENIAKGDNSVIAGYALGKAQRILAHLDTSIGSIYTHGAVANLNEIMLQNGLDLPFSQRITPEMTKKDIKGAMIIAPPSAIGTPWMKRFEPYSLGICSGWMQLRGARRRRGADRGFIMSDHCDWQQLNTAVLATGAENIYVTHGYKSLYAKWLSENYGLNAREVETLYEGETIEGDREEPSV
ncbi:ligase-associated DNA damage response exonuclease [Chitinophagaceae bacterium MMS25-I14]